MVITERHVKSLRDHVEHLYKLNRSGGLLHVVLSDYNIDDTFMMASLREILAAEDQHSYEVTLCLRIWEMLARLTHAQRWLYIYANALRDGNLCNYMNEYETCAVREPEEGSDLPYSSYLELPDGDRWMP